LNNWDLFITDVKALIGVSDTKLGVHSGCRSLFHLHVFFPIKTITIASCTSFEIFVGSNRWESIVAHVKAVNVDIIRTVGCSLFQVDASVFGNGGGTADKYDEGTKHSLHESFPIESVKIINRWCINPSDSRKCLCRLSNAGSGLEFHF
jgi:hypothetical protein